MIVETGISEHLKLGFRGYPNSSSLNKRKINYYK
jgi:hypothetical protein